MSYVVNYIDLFLNVKYTLYFCGNSNLVMIHYAFFYYIFYILLDLTLQYLVKDFCVYIYKGYWTAISFSRRE